MSSAGTGPSPATTCERDAASAQLVHPAHSLARSAPVTSLPSAGRSVTAGATAAPAASANRRRRPRQRRKARGVGRERREQLLDLARGALRARDERAVARDELLEAVLAGTTCVLVDGHGRIVPCLRGRLNARAPAKWHSLRVPLGRRAPEAAAGPAIAPFRPNGTRGEYHLAAR